MKKRITIAALALVALYAGGVFAQALGYIPQGPTLFPNTGLLVRDSDASTYLRVKPGSNLTAPRTLTVTTGDADRTFTINGDFVAPAGTAIVEGDARLTDARTPNAHAASHQHLGSDEIANATPQANGIVKANGSGLIANGWLDTDIAAIASLASGANLCIRYTGSGTAETFTCTNAGLALMDDASPAAQIATLGGFGSSAATFCEGNDSRLTNDRASTVADAADDATTWCMFARSQTGSQHPATDASCTYDASTNTLGLSKISIASTNDVNDYWQTIDPTETSTNFLFSTRGFDNPEAGTKNHVFRMGWNLASGGGRVDATKAAMGIEMENFYNQVGVDPWQEMHFIFTETDGTIRRAISLAHNEVTGDTSTSFIGSSYTYVNPSGTTIAALNANGWNLVGNTFIASNTNNQTLLYQRNAAGTSDIPLIKLNTSNRIEVGHWQYGTTVPGDLKVATGYAIPAGGTAGLGTSYSTTSNFGTFFGSGAPTLSAAQGSIYLRSNGSTPTTRAYVNTNGTTGWANLFSGVATQTDVLIGRSTSGAGDVEEIACTASGRSMIGAASAAAQTALLSAFVGDSGAGGTKGLVPAPATGDSGKFLKGDGTWTAIAGGGDALTANPLSQFAATTSAQLAGVLSDETGSGAACFATSPTLVTPTLGVASATSVNKVAITTPATSATLTIADGATLTASATASVSGTNTGDQFTAMSTDKCLARVTAGSGAAEEVTCTDAFQSLWDDATTSDMRNTLGVGTVYQYLHPGNAELFATAQPEWKKIDGTNFPVNGYAFDAATDEQILWQFRAYRYGSGNLTLDVEWYADTASSGDVIFGAQLACITPNTDSQDIETDALATANTVTDTHLGTTGQRLHRATITISNTDSIAADDDCVLRLYRDANDGSDTMTGDAIVTGATVSWST